MSIPRRIIQLWLGPGEPSPFLLDCGHSIVRQHPDWEHWFYRLRTDDDAREVLAPVADLLGLDLFGFYLRMGEFARSDQYSKENTPATLQSDLVRMALVYEHGGIYLDMDVYALQPLDKFLHHDLFFGYIHENLIGEFLIAAEPQHPIIADIIRAYVHQPLANREGLLNLTQWVKDKSLKAYRTEYFCPHYKVTGDIYHHTPNTHLIHCWRQKQYDLTTLQFIRDNIKELNATHGRWDKDTLISRITEIEKRLDELTAHQRTIQALWDEAMDRFENYRLQLCDMGVSDWRQEPVKDSCA